MAHWLIKSEPETWSWDDQTRVASEPWSGVRNAQASNYMKAMAKGDTAFFYHSGKERSIVGVVKVVGTYRADPTDPSGRFGLVDVAAVRPFASPVTLAAIKADPRFADLALLRQSRLSVMPIPDDAWEVICAMGAARP